MLQGEADDDDIERDVHKKDDESAEGGEPIAGPSGERPAVKKSESV